jgi:hypothetical protein
MMHIVLDSGPLGLLLQKPKYAQRDQCRDWLLKHLADGDRFYAAEIIEYELRRELLRMNNTLALGALDVFVTSVPGRRLPLMSADLRLAAELWAQTRQQGKPTADIHALDIDVILSAQVINCALPQSDIVVATTNTKHLSYFVDAREWNTI